MRQILQDLKGGELLVEDVPAPSVRDGHVLIRTRRTLISAGTERMLTQFARANMLDKARQQPDKVRQTLDKLRTDGAVATYQAVNEKLSRPIPLGYCNVGRVLEVGQGVAGLAVGDLVASNGGHSEIVCVSRNLCAKVPDGVAEDQAAFVVIGSIALQGIRLIAPTLGETVVVMGLGLVGLMAVQILRANGCQVLGFDNNSSRVELARSFGVKAQDISGGLDPVLAVQQATNGERADAVLIAASAAGNAIVGQSAEMSRKRGRIVLTGVVGLDLQRDQFYEKELSFQVSCSYGPGRYDASYEDQGQDYPLPFVRWTEGRNFQAVLELMRDERIRVEPLISCRFPLADAVSAYARLDDAQTIGILLDYAEEPSNEALLAKTVPSMAQHQVASGAGLGIIGAGDFAQARILPSLRKAGVRLKTVVSAQGTSGAVAARRFGIEQSTTDYREALNDPEIGALVVATRHDSHAFMVREAIAAGKHVYVEKPLCLTTEELESIVEEREAALAAGRPVPMVMVGFNRRFAPLAQAMRAAMDARQGPAFVSYLCNAGPLPADHWTVDAKVGGGRIVGEACHFIDFLRFLTASPIVAVTAACQRTPDGQSLDDNVVATFRFEDGSLGQMSYIAQGHKSYPKEHCLAMFDGKVLELNNFRSLKGYGVGAGKRSYRQDKGHNASFAAYVEATRQGGPAPIAFDEIENVTRATLAVATAQRSGREVVLA